MAKFNRGDIVVPIVITLVGSDRRTIPTNTELIVLDPRVHGDLLFSCDVLCGVIGSPVTVMASEINFKLKDSHTPQTMINSMFSKPPRLKDFYAAYPLEEIQLQMESAIFSNKCECGSSKVGSPKHSNWCKLYKKEI